MNQLLTGMNEKQIEAIQQTDGPLLVLAGAGSGKTRVLTHRIAYLIQEKDVPAYHILAITFTNKAAKEMKERLTHLVGELAVSSMWVSTFHAMCVRILRREASAIGYTRSFSIIDTTEQKTLMKQVIKARNLDEKRYDYRAILAAISTAKNKLLTPEQFAEQASHFLDDVISDCYADYQKLLYKHQVMDFDDLIMQTVLLFRKYPDILSFYQQKFQYIHVDEYQDTNKAQYELVLQLSRYFKNLCVVGDADQSIYAWRGADMQNILNFEKDFPMAKTVLLEQNYRSTQTILDAANKVIAHNQERKPKKLWTDNAKGDDVTYYRANSENDEANYVAQTIVSQAYPWHQSAILYRTNAQSRALEEALLKQNIAYRIVGGVRFYDRAEIKDMLAYLRLVANPADDLSFMRVVNVPKRGIGKTSLDKLQQFAISQQCSLVEAVSILPDGYLSSRASNTLKAFVAFIEQLQMDNTETNVTDLLEAIITKTGYVAALAQQQTLEADARIENIEELLSATLDFDKRPVQPENENLEPLIVFLSDVTLDNERQEDTDNAVTLMTIHAAKGLEFPVVFLVGLEENIFPSARSIQEDSNVEEERRLMYVAMTRAEQKLYCIHASTRLLYGKTQYNRPSRFLDELGALQPVQMHKAAVTVQKRVQAKQTGIVWKVGDKVKHNKWGIGRIVRTKGEGDDSTLDIAFDGQGIKTLLASFAPIEKL